MQGLQVIAVTAVRTGSGKSQVSHYVIGVLKEHGLRTVLVRHPMPYGAHTLGRPVSLRMIRIEMKSQPDGSALQESRLIKAMGKVWFMWLLHLSSHVRIY